MKQVTDAQIVLIANSPNLTAMILPIGNQLPLGALPPLDPARARKKAA